MAGFREEAETLAKTLVDQYYERASLREAVLSFARKEAGTLVEHPFEDDLVSTVLRDAKNRKWFGLLMTVPYAKLGFPRAGLADVINIKVDPARIALLCDGHYFFPSYHMNKKYWMTLLLDAEAPLGEIEDLIRASHALVQNKKKK